MSHILTPKVFKPNFSITNVASMPKVPNFWNAPVNDKDFKFSTIDTSFDFKQYLHKAPPISHPKKSENDKLFEPFEEKNHEVDFKLRPSNKTFLEDVKSDPSNPRLTINTSDIIGDPVSLLKNKPNFKPHYELTNLKNELAKGNTIEKQANYISEIVNNYVKKRGLVIADGQIIEGKLVPDPNSKPFYYVDPKYMYDEKPKTKPKRKDQYTDYMQFSDASDTETHYAYPKGSEYSSGFKTGLDKIKAGSGSKKKESILSPVLTDISDKDDDGYNPIRKPTISAASAATVAPKHPFVSALDPSKLNAATDYVAKHFLNNTTAKKMETPKKDEAKTIETPKKDEAKTIETPKGDKVFDVGKITENTPIKTFVDNANAILAQLNEINEEYKGKKSPRPKQNQKDLVNNTALSLGVHNSRDSFNTKTAKVIEAIKTQEKLANEEKAKKEKMAKENEEKRLERGKMAIKITADRAAKEEKLANEEKAKKENVDKILTNSRRLRDYERMMKEKEEREAKAKEEKERQEKYLNEMTPEERAKYDKQKKKEEEERQKRETKEEEKDKKRKITYTDKFGHSRFTKGMRHTIGVSYMR